MFENETRLRVLEVWNRVPDCLSEASIIAKVEAIEIEVEAEKLQEAATDHVQDEKRATVRPSSCCGR